MARTVKHQTALLLDRFGRHEPHVWPRDRFANRLRQSLEECQDVPSLQLPAQDHSAGRVNSMHLKDRLGDIKTDCRNRLHSWLLRIVGALSGISHLGTLVPVEEPSTASQAEVHTKGLRYVTSSKSPGFNVWQRPASVEVGLPGCVEPEVRKPELVRRRLHPVRFLSGGSRRPKIQVHRAVRVLLKPFVV